MTDSAQTAPELLAHFPVQTTLSKRTVSSALRSYRLPPELWPDIQQRAKHESLRQLAAEYGVSHEAIRRIVNMKQTRRADWRRSAYQNAKMANMTPR
jgi:hypothetical protein